MVKTPETIWQMPNEELLNFLNTGLECSRRKKIRFYAPSFMHYKTAYFCSSPRDFPTISVTGKSCALKCKHCGGKVLETMYPVKTPEELYNLCSRLKAEGAVGCLISGGCLPNGSVPLDNFTGTIKRVKEDLGLTVFAHVGVLDYKRALRLKEAGVDAALIDILGANETIKEVYNLNLTVESYERALKALNQAGLPFIPHVIVGLHYGKLKGEFNALRIISRYKPSALVVIAFMPIYGTAMAHVEPPKPLDIARVLTIARIMFPETPIALGCMRPKGRHRTETDVLAIKACVDAIAFPAEEAIKFACDQGFKTSFSSYCCSQIYLDFLRINSV
ncbi:MAG: radical SAM protein [Candidatus Bathyarchaeia archaeon]|nr:radical SAM protein [Candidatus Bathyarchaeota archaeon]